MNQQIEKNSLDEISNKESSTDKLIKSRKRPSKCEKFVEERKELIEEINKMIGINESKNNKILYELENNEELKEKIRENITKIRKYYRCSTWGYFSKEKKKGMNNEIGLIKALYKNEGYKILTKRKTCEYNGIKKLQTELYFIKG